MSTAAHRTPIPRRPLTGGCACGGVRYALTASPLIVHACHCRDCQRVTGSAFVVKLWIEREHVMVRKGEPGSARLAAGSGGVHEVFFCPQCATYVGSRYARAPGDTLFVRAGTLDRPDAVAPDVHIFTRSKQPWLTLPGGRARVLDVLPDDRDLAACEPGALATEPRDEERRGAIGFAGRIWFVTA